jgi:hypothetical protein
MEEESRVGDLWNLKERKEEKNKDFHLEIESCVCITVCMYAFFFPFSFWVPSAILRGDICLCMVRCFFDQKRVLHRLACDSFHVHVVFYLSSISVMTLVRDVMVFFMR